MRVLKQYALKAAHHAAYSLKRGVPERFVHKNVLYFAQWESRELVKRILEKDIQAEDDPQWRASGAVTKAEYRSWSWSGCGMACTKMLLAHRTGEVVPLVTLGKRCVAYGGYTMPLETSPGLFYKPYVTFVQKEFGWRAKIVSGMPLRGVIYELGQGNYIIASVSPDIREPKSTPPTRSGHLVLLLGYDKLKQELYLHNPSGKLAETQEYAAISFADFRKFFGGRGIVISGSR